MGSKPVLPYANICMSQIDKKIKALAEEDKAAFLALLKRFWMTSFSFFLGFQENFMTCLKK